VTVDGSVDVNARYLVHRTTGMQRYAQEVAQRLAGDINLIRPRRDLAGVLGHAWEQGVLPFRRSAPVLWSPCNTGPLAVRGQVVTVHDIAPIEHPEWFTPSFVRLNRELVGRLARRVPIVLAVSEFTRLRVAERLGVPLEKIRVTGEGASEKFRPQTTERIQETLGVHGLRAAGYFLFVGNLTPRKNLPHLIRAFRLAIPHLDDRTELVMVGAGSATNAFPAQELAGASDPVGQVRQLDYVDDADLPPLMAGALAVVVPSHYEGFGLPPLEAMATGAVVVASRATALPEVVGDGGLLTEPDDDESLADALVQVATDAELRERLRSAGLVRARAFTWERAAEVTEQALADVAG
jgi:glycosyltransferase involved in cell wall biosynthesis